MLTADFIRILSLVMRPLCHHPLIPTVLEEASVFGFEIFRPWEGSALKNPAEALSY
jgi:hypothetical protein